VSGAATVRDPVTNTAGDESFSWTTPSPWVRNLLVSRASNPLEKW